MVVNYKNILIRQHKKRVSGDDFAMLRSYFMLPYRVGKHYSGELRNNQKQDLYMVASTFYLPEPTFAKRESGRFERFDLL